MINPSTQPAGASVQISEPLSPGCPSHPDRPPGEVPMSPSQCTFSEELDLWLRSDGPKTLGSLDAAFAERSAAIAAMLLMFVPALPLPTGGISHAFELLTIIISAQMLAGRQALWLPRRWRSRELGAITTGKAIPAITRWVRRLERLSKPRGSHLLSHRASGRIVGGLLIVTAVTALLAPPFSGLDTLPGIGAVLIGSGFVLRDAVVIAAGVGIAVIGAAIILAAGATLAHSISFLL